MCVLLVRGRRSGRTSAARRSASPAAAPRRRTPACTYSSSSAKLRISASCLAEGARSPDRRARRARPRPPARRRARPRPPPAPPCGSSSRSSLSGWRIGVLPHEAPAVPRLGAAGGRPALGFQRGLQVLQLLGERGPLAPARRRSSAATARPGSSTITLKPSSHTTSARQAWRVQRRAHGDRGRGLGGAPRAAAAPGARAAGRCASRSASAQAAAATTAVGAVAAAARSRRRRRPSSTPAPNGQRRGAARSTTTSAPPPPSSVSAAAARGRRRRRGVELRARGRHAAAPRRGRADTPPTAPWATACAPAPAPTPTDSRRPATPRVRLMSERVRALTNRRAA